MPGKNLTRDEAREPRQHPAPSTPTTSRLDLTTGPENFRTATTVRSPAPSPAPTRSSTSSRDSVEKVTLNGVDLDPAEVFADSRIALPAPGCRQRAHRRRDGPLHQHRRGPAPVRRPGRQRGLPLHAVRGPGLPAHVRRVRAARPQGVLPLHGDRTRALEGHLQLPHARPRGGRGRRRRRARDLVVRADPAHLHRTSPPSSPARTTRSATRSETRKGVVPLGVYCRKSLDAVPRRRQHLRLHQAGLRVLRGGVRPAVPVREVRPALRARVQHGRDGERRRRDLPRGLRLPVQGHRGDDRAPGADDPARAGAHVVRRPRHHEVVGRPLAQRVVRRVGVDDAARPRPPSGRARGRPSATPREGVGLPPGPAALDPPDRGRHAPTSRPSRSTSTASPTPRAPPCSSSSSPTWGASRSSPALREYFAEARVGQHRRSRTCSASWRRHRAAS